MGTFTFNHPELLERDVKDIFFKNFGMIPLMYTGLFTTKTSTKAYEDGMRVAGLGTFHTKAEVEDMNDVDLVVYDQNASARHE